MLAEGEPTAGGVPKGSGLLPQTNALEEMYGPVRVAMKIPSVMEALGLNDLQVAPLAPALAGAAERTSPLGSLAPERRFSEPGTLPPGGRPVASMARVVNPTERPLQGTLRPTVMLGDAGLCRALKMAAISFEESSEPVVLLAGDLSQTMRDPVTPFVLEPGKAYDLAILLSLPPNVPNEFR